MENKRKTKITISDIAKLAEVSKTTVSFYLNGRYERMSAETKSRIDAVIEKTGYQPSMIARSLNAKQTKIIGVVIGDITNSFANQIVKGIEEVIRECGYQMIVGSTNYELENEKRCINGMRAMGVDGYIVQPTVFFETMWNEMNVGKPIVYFDSPSSLNHGMWVKTNTYEAVYDAVEKLVKKGYEEYVMITADPHVLSTRMERYRGFTDYLENRGIPYKVIVADKTTEQSDLKKQLEPYLNKEKSSCVFVCNNWLLDKAYLILRDYIELMPEYLGLIGFDSLEWTELAVPSISTIVQPSYEEGETAGRMIIDRIEMLNNEAPQQILKCRMNELESTRRK